MLDKYQPDLALVGYPVTDEVQHQFLGLVTKKLPNGAANPAYDDVEVNGTPDHRVKQREEFIRACVCSGPMRRCGSPRSTCATAT